MTRSQTSNSPRWPIGRRRPAPEAPVVDVDLCSVSKLRSPEQSYRAIRDAGRGTNLGWGFGTHACVGMHLSKLEMEALLKEIVQRVGAITVSDPQRLINNGLQGLKSFRVTFR